MQKKFIIFIDDLDRCFPENSIVLLESIKNFFSTDNCTFILAIDTGVLSEAIRSKYGYSSIITGEDYLDKIIKFNYDLPVSLEYIIRAFLSTLSQSNPGLFQDSLVSNYAP